MKKVFVLFVGMFLIAGISQAQEDPVKLLKKAGKYLGSYNLDPSSNKDKLAQAKEAVDQAMASPDMEASSKGWNTKGRIYSELAASEAAMLTLNKEYVPNYPDAAVESYKAFNKGLEHAVKKYERKDALKGLAEVAGFLNTLGYRAYQASDFTNAFTQFDAVLKVNDLLKANEMKPILGDDKSVNDQLYIAAVSAMSGENMEAAGKYFEVLKDSGLGDEKPAIYEGLFKAYIDTDEEKAVALLQEGREKHPEEASLLFAEINYYLQKGELDQLLGKLEKAAEIEKDNPSIYNTIANVYDSKYQKASEEGNAEEAEASFTKAYDNYNLALEKDPENFVAIYSLGALYYNKAAVASKEVNALADDYSNEGTKKYNAKKEEMFGYFDKAMPYFLRAEKINAGDKNTLIALQEIYARKDDLETANAYKAKLEALKE